MTIYRDECPHCDGKKDRRARMCLSCRFKLDHPRKGTGAAKRFSKTGYVLVMVDNKERYEHRVIMERILGRALSRDEHVHHKNHDKTDNSPDNLEVLSASEHHRSHYRERKIDCLGRLL